MPTYEVTLGGQTVTVVQPGIDNPGTRRAAVIVAAQQMSLSIQHGIHGIVVPDGNDGAATAIQIPRGQHEGVWIETPSPRQRPEQAQAAQARKAKS